MSDLSNAEKREIWNLCADTIMHQLREKNLHGGEAIGFLKAEGIRRYPDPKEPTIVTFENGDQMRIVDKRAQLRMGTDGSWFNTSWTVSDCLGLGEIAQESLTNTQENGK